MLLGFISALFFNHLTEGFFFRKFVAVTVIISFPLMRKTLVFVRIGKKLTHIGL